MFPGKLKGTVPGPEVKAEDSAGQLQAHGAVWGVVERSALARKTAGYGCGSA